MRGLVNGPLVFCERMGLCFCFPIYRSVLPCFVPSQMVMSSRFLGFVDVTKLVLRHALTKVFCLAICGEGCGFLDAKAHVCGLCVCGVAHARWNFWLLFRDTSVDLHICGGQWLRQMLRESAR